MSSAGPDSDAASRPRGTRPRSSTNVQRGTRAPMTPMNNNITTVGFPHTISHAERRHRRHAELHGAKGHFQEHHHEHDYGRSHGHTRTNSAPSPETTDIETFQQPTTPAPQHSALLPSPMSPTDMGFPGGPDGRVILSLYTYQPPVTTLPPKDQQASLVPAPAHVNSTKVLLSHASMPWPVRPGDYLEIRKVSAPQMPARPGPKPVTGAGDKANELDALAGVKPNKGRDGYVFRLGEDCPTVPVNQIQVPNGVATAFKMQHRQDVEICRIPEPESAEIDYIELHFSQYVGRSDMWRIGMSLENQAVHVGEKVTLAGGAVRADVHGIWKGKHRRASGIVTSKTKTIYRSKSAQTYLFIQICQETYEFDEDGERYYEKVLHGFLPELFQKWTAVNATHLVTVVLFARVYYNDDEVEYLRKYDLGLGLMKDHRDRWCKDFYKVAIDFERRSDWMTALTDVKQHMERCEAEILRNFHLNLMVKNGFEKEQKRIIGHWSFAYEGNVLEAINLALNPFDEHNIDRDLSRTGLSLIVITPGTGHFSVEKNMLRLTTERMIDHGVTLDLVCLTKMPLHSVPLFSYMSERPKRQTTDVDGKTGPATPDPLYFDANMDKPNDRELTECYSLAFWVYCSFYAKTHDKPFRRDRFVPRCKMYEIQMLGILDHNLTTVVLPLLDVPDVDSKEKKLSDVERKLIHEDFDAAIFSDGKTPNIKDASVSPPSTARTGTISPSLSTSLQSTRRFHRMDDGLSASPKPPLASRGSSRTPASIVELEENLSNPSNPSLPDVSGPIASGVSGMIPDMPLVKKSSGHLGLSQRRPSTIDQSTPSSRVASIVQLGSSPTHSITSTATEHPTSGASTPKLTPSKKLKNQSSRGSFASRFAATWLFSSLGARASPSTATTANETVQRQDVSSAFGSSKPSSPSSQRQELQPPISVPATPQPVPGALPPSPKPKARAVSNAVTQPLPILANPARAALKNEEIVRSMPRSIPKSIPRSLPKSMHNSLRQARSMEDSWRNKSNAAFGRTCRHTTVNPCNPDEDDIQHAHKQRWQHVRPRFTMDRQKSVKWRSLCAPAILPLTTDFMPTPEEIATFYEAHSYDIACFPDQVSFLIRPDAAQVNLPLAVMREMASQRLSQNFQFIVLPHNTVVTDVQTKERANPLGTGKNLLLGDSTRAGLRVGGASEVLKDASGAIYLSWSNHVHRLTFDPQKQSVTVQRFVRKVRHSTAPHSYKCLVWPNQLHDFQEATAMFRYPNIDAKLNFNYLDRLIAGEEDRLQSNLRFWRTRYLLIPSGKELPSLQNVMKKGNKEEEYAISEILITGAMKVLELMGKNQWTRPGEHARPLRLLATTFDPSACVLDEGLMSELDRLTNKTDKIDSGHKLEGMTLQELAAMMNKPNNGLIIRDRWWNFKVHEDSFTGEQFCEWLKETFSDVETREQAVEWAESLFSKGLIEHVMGKHNFHDTYFFYRLSTQYDNDAKSQTNRTKNWFGKPAFPLPKNWVDEAKPLRLTDKPAKKKKVKMSQSVVIDLDPHKKSDRAEVAILHADIVHNTRNAFHFELNWLGVTAGLLEELRAKASALAERYGLRLVEAPVEQIKDINQKCAYRAPIPIRLALAPPVIPDLHLRLTESSGSGQCAHYFEYAILTQKFGFVLDLEATERYPDTIEVEYAYRSKARFEYSQFVHRSGLALVQCAGREDGFLWADNRPFISAPTRGRQQSAESYAGNLTPMATKQEQARMLREELEAFCADPVALAQFYEEVTPPPPSVLSPDKEKGEKDKTDKGDKDKGEKKPEKKPEKSDRPELRPVKEEKGEKGAEKEKKPEKPAAGEKKPDPKGDHKPEKADKKSDPAKDEAK